MIRRDRPSVGIRKATRTQGRVLSALVVREALGRYGHDNLGFFWILAEPLLLAGAVMIMWKFAKHNNIEHIGLVLFVLSGYCCLTLWRHIVSKSVRGISSRAALLYHINVKPLDLLLASSILEIIGVFAAFLVAYIPLALFDVVHFVRDPLLVVCGFFLLGWFASAVAMILAGLTERYQLLEKFIQPLMYITIPLTGVFAMVEWLPQKAQNFYLYSPMVHAVEMVRSGLMPDEIITHFSATYLISCCVVMSAIGILLMKNVQKHLGS